MDDKTEPVSECMKIAMLLDSGHLPEGAATLASLAVYSEQEPLHLFIFVDNALDANVCNELTTSLRQINDNNVLNWVKIETDDINQLSSFIYVMQYFCGQRIVVIDHKILFAQKLSKIYAFFSKTHLISGVVAYDAQFCGEAIFLPPGEIYVNSSLLWVDLRDMQPEELLSIGERAKRDTISTLLGDGLEGALNRAFAGSIDAVRASWQPYWMNSFCLCGEASSAKKEKLALFLCNEITDGFSFTDKIRLRYLKNTKLYDNYAKCNRFYVSIIIRSILKNINKFKLLFYIAIKKQTRAVKSRIEYNHAIAFRGIRDKLMELNSTNKEKEDFLFGQIKYDNVLTLENADYIYGELGIKSTYKLLFGINNIKQFDAKFCTGRSAVFFHILRNAKIKKQIDILLMAVSGTIDVYFVETGFICCITNVNIATIPMRFRRNSSYLVDDRGFYYDATLPTRLETYLNSEAAILNSEENSRATRLIETIVENKISKYNYLLTYLPAMRECSRQRVLVVDQSKKDASVTRGMADESTFHEMLEAAMRENPDAEILVKTHPDSINRGRGSYFAEVRSSGRIRKISESVNPYSLLEHVNTVYVCTSLLGLEALFCKKEVHVFGMPFYAGWGLSKDRQKIARRTRKLTLQELAYAVYIKFSIYFDPLTGERVEVERYINGVLTLREEYFSLYDRESMQIAREHGARSEGRKIQKVK